MMQIKSQNKLLLPCATAFIAGFCIMVVELIATRIIARYLGSSIYTWTAVIGVVLGGIALGNYLGGLIADKFDPKRTLSLLFICASISCIFIAPLSQLMGQSTVLLLLPLSGRIILHVAAIFLVPSAIFGMISPVVAKHALSQGLATGRTIGNIYAWTSTGSIVGVFLTGFVLISLMGTMSIVWILCGILALVGLLYGVKRSLPYIWAFVFILALFLNVTNPALMQSIGEKAGIQEMGRSRIVFETESQQSFIQVTRSEKNPSRLTFVLDHLIHSVMDIEHPTDINASYQYPYIKMYGALADVLGQEQDSRFLVIGGGAYVFPRHLEEQWPQGSIDVVEIDPEVTRVAHDIFKMPKDTKIKTHNMDARNYVNELAAKDNSEQFDLIFSDAVSGLSVPYPLTTYEYNEKIKKLLSSDGVYILTLIDSMSPGKFLGAVVNTLEKTFPHIYTYSPDTLYGIGVNFGDTFVVVCSMNPIDLSELSLGSSLFAKVNDAQLTLMKENAKQAVLTDDYAPVDNLLVPVFYSRGRRLASAQLTNMANQIAEESDFDRAIKYYNKAIRADNSFAQAYNNLGNVFARQGMMRSAIDQYEIAVRLWPGFAEAYSNIGTLSVKQGNIQEGINYLNQALDINPDSPEVYYNLGTVFAGMGVSSEAIKQYEMAIENKPDFAEAHIGLGNLYWGEKQLDKAADEYKKALESKEDPQAHNNIGAILAEQGKREAAAYHWRQALKLDPTYENARKNLNSVLLELDQMNTRLTNGGEHNG